MGIGSAQIDAVKSSLRAVDSMGLVVFMTFAAWLGLLFGVLSQAHEAKLARLTAEAFLRGGLDSVQFGGGYYWRAFGMGVAFAVVSVVLVVFAAALAVEKTYEEREN